MTTAVSCFHAPSNYFLNHPTTLEVLSYTLYAIAIITTVTGLLSIEATVRGVQLRHLTFLCRIPVPWGVGIALTGLTLGISTWCFLNKVRQEALKILEKEKQESKIDSALYIVKKANILFATGSNRVVLNM